MLGVALWVLAGAQQGQGADGNPHGWDRLRRCDHVGYLPACGACEGLGGIVWSDAPKDITIPHCDVVSTTVDPKTLAWPKWGGSLDVAESHEILIGPKQDPFCFKVFPMNSSEGQLCYKPQTGRIRNGLATPAKMLREDMNQKNFGKNVSSLILHQGRNMWIINSLLLGVKQCICTQPKEAGAAKTADVYPVQWNWTSNLKFVARERLTVEYGVGARELDHFAFGPHHAWVTPGVGDIVRMWQPFNGLQVFATPPKYAVDAADFPEVPPADCKKGGATFRIKCSDDGWPETHAEAPAAAVLLTGKETGRARRKVPGKAYRGDHHVQTSMVLNRWLSRAVEAKACEEWTADELRELVGTLTALRHPDLDEIYNATKDKRKLRNDAPRWARVDAVEDAHLQRVHRDGLCHEAVMMYVHHLTEETQKLLASATPIPMLSMTPHARPTGPASTDEDAVYSLYEDHVSCASCHSNAPVPPSATSVLV